MNKTRFVVALTGLAAAAAIFTAPDAMAADSATSCVNTGTATVCDGQLAAAPTMSFASGYPFYNGDDMHSGGHGGR